MGCMGSSLIFEGLEIDLDAAPTDADRELHGQTAAVLKDGAGVLTLLENHESCSDICRRALADPIPSNRLAALEAVTKTALQVYAFFQHSEAVSKVVIAILQKLIADIPQNAQKINPQIDIKFGAHAALVSQLAQLLCFTLTFDNLKTLNGAIQNDLSMYRRMCQGAKTTDPDSPGSEDTESIAKLAAWQRPAELDPDTVSATSFMIASPIPILSQLVTKILDLAGNDPRIDLLMPHVPNLYLAQLDAGKKSPSDSVEKYDNLVKGMTCAIIMLDRTEPEGAFHSHSAAEVSPAITCIKTYNQNYPDSKVDVEMLLNGLRYWTIHVQDVTTPDSISKKLDVA